MKHGSLFSGIGGFDLAAQWMGWENVFHCEWNEFGKRVLNYYWPNAISYHDITKTDFTIHRGGIDIITGGFPCQPYSAAGKRLGKDDDRHLWPEMLRAIREIQPRWVVGENVRGITNWNGGLVFDEVQADLEAIGYEVTAFILPACAVDAPHRRDRVWFIAYADNGRQDAQNSGNTQSKRNPKNDGKGPTTYPNSNGQHRRNSQYEKHASQGGEYAQRNAFHSGGKGHTPNPKGGRCRFCFAPNIWPPSGKKHALGNPSPLRIQQLTTDPQQPGRKRADIFTGSARPEQGTWDSWPTVEPTIRRGDDGFSDRLDGITFPKWRSESIKAYGNAVVPQVVYQIFKAIEQYENDTLPT